MFISMFYIINSLTLFMDPELAEQKSVHLTEGEREQIMNSILKHKLQNVQEPYSRQFFLNVIQVVSEMPVELETIRAVKILISVYGVCILPFLQPFYQKITHENKEQHEDILKMLASLAKEATESKEIEEIQFMFKFGTSQKPQKKKVKNTEETIIFLSDVEKLSQLKKKIMHNKYSFQQGNQYLNFVNQLKQKYNQEEVKMFFIESFSEENKIKISQAKSEISSARTCNSSIPEQKSIPQKIQVNNSQISVSIMSENEKNIPQKIQVSKSQISTSMSDKISSASTVCSSTLGFSHYQEPTINLCCKRFFYDGERIDEPNSLRYQYTFLRYPFNFRETNLIKQIICSFLNADGGTLFIGIKKTQDKRKVVEGAYYCQSSKEELLINFRRFVAQEIEPDIITDKRYVVDFVPIKEKRTNCFKHGFYVVKVTVKYGVRDQIYSCRDNDIDKFMFRTETEIFSKEGRKVLNDLRKRIKSPLPIPIPIHSGNCLKPQLGHLAHDVSAVNFKMQSPKRQFKEKSPPREILYENPISMKKKQPFPRQVLVQQVPKIKKQEQFYFYIVGLTEQQLGNLLEKKDVRLKNKINIEAVKTGSKKIVVRCLESEIDIIRKIFRKITQKYPDKIIHELKQYIYLPNKAMQTKQELRKNYNLNWEQSHKYFIKLQNPKEKLTAFLIAMDNGCDPKFVDNPT